MREPLRVSDYRAYGRPPTDTVLPVGTYWVSMDQGQKHWVQAMLNEDTYVPFPYFYDVTAWSGPLLFNVDGGASGEQLRPVAVRAPVQPPAVAPTPPDDAPTLGLLQLSDNSSAQQSSGWLRWLLTERWGLAYADLTAQDVADGGLEGIDVLLVPNGDAFTGLRELGPTGSQQLRDWVRQGGRYVGWQGGTVLAAVLGVTTARLSEPTSDIPGSLLRVTVDERAPLADGVGPFAWTFYAYDPVMTASDPDSVMVGFPPADSQDFFVSGFARGEDQLGGTAAVIAETVGDGSSVVFSFEPNFRGFTDGTQKFLRNSVLGPSADEQGAAGSRAPAFGDPPAGLARQEVRRARAAARDLSRLQAPIRLSVTPDSAAAARRLLEETGATYETQITPGRVSFRIANPEGLAAEESALALELSEALRASQVDVMAFSVP
ncbi:MAG: hypothetical protein ACR2MA_03060 [Egibacteraceae bacterium]